MEQSPARDVREELLTLKEPGHSKDLQTQKIRSVKRKLNIIDRDHYGTDINIVIKATSGLTKDQVQAKKKEGIKNLIPEISPKSWERLSRYSKVIRDNKTVKVNREDLLPGDILVFTKGDKINADTLLIDISGDDKVVTVDAFLYTESTEPLVKEKIHSIGDPWERQEIILTGCEILSGSGKGFILAVGEETILGKIMKSFEKKMLIETDPIVLDLKLTQ